MSWGPLCARGNLMGSVAWVQSPGFSRLGSVAKMRQQLKAPKSTHRNDGGGKDRARPIPIRSDVPQQYLPGSLAISTSSVAARTAFSSNPVAAAQRPKS